MNGQKLNDCQDVNKLQKCVDFLFSRLDDIDTLSDQIKPSDETGYKAFYEAAMNLAKQRSYFVDSDGYNLFVK